MVYPTNIPNRPRSQNLGPKPLVAVSLTMILAALLLDFDKLQTLLPSTNTISHQAQCNTVISDDAKLSREQLAQLLTIPERDAKSRVRQVVSEPYCQLPTLKVRSGVEAEREAYPLAFDPGTTLVILYENNEYAGYRFSFE
ncbi:hypothetical protein N836_02435 [Leptolyngbya sp. Heron Island J]|uniref:hypothetical protein n=1 Tax=Leptolyngbya sp. Heron Island J TaxID=1385935 RepID=UPI0003B9D858|nr:hypothetical protein [Leptolyngbya sp. Heron Island J]ESA38378.1 hypothetical protein N836_02435 [Leptolyngbya sp. Heron Island J]